MISYLSIAWTVIKSFGSTILSFFTKKGGGVNWTNILIIVCIGLLIGCVWLKISNSSLETTVAKRDVRIAELTHQYDELKLAFDQVELSSKNKDVAIATLQTRITSMSSAYDNSIDILQKKYQLCLSNPTTKPKDTAISNGEIIDDKTSDVYLDIFTTNIFNSRLRK